MKQSHFFAFLSRMKYINRWGLMRNTRMENLAEHSMEVAMLAHGLCVIANVYFGENLNADRAGILALYHDASEVITGDMPTPIKYFNPAIKGTYGEIEAIANKKIIEMLPEETQQSYSEILREKEKEETLWLRVKAADKLSAYIKCIEEQKAGNQEFKKAAAAILENLRQSPLPEVGYFLDMFMESYALTLDEQD